MTSMTLNQIQKYTFCSFLSMKAWDPRNKTCGMGVDWNMFNTILLQLLIKLFIQHKYCKYKHFSFNVFTVTVPTDQKLNYGIFLFNWIQGYLIFISLDTGYPPVHFALAFYWNEM